MEIGSWGYARESLSMIGTRGNWGGMQIGWAVGTSGVGEQDDSIPHQSCRASEVGQDGK